MLFMLSCKAKLCYSICHVDRIASSLDYFFLLTSLDNFLRIFPAQRSIVSARLRIVEHLFSFSPRHTQNSTRMISPNRNTGQSEVTEETKCLILTRFSSYLKNVPSNYISFMLRTPQVKITALLILPSMVGLFDHGFRPGSYHSTFAFSPYMVVQFIGHHYGTLHFHVALRKQCSHSSFWRWCFVISFPLCFSVVMSPGSYSAGDSCCKR